MEGGYVEYDRKQHALKQLMDAIKLMRQSLPSFVGTEDIYIKSVRGFLSI